MASFRLPPAFLEELRAGAERLGISRARLIVEAVREYLSRH